MKKEKEKRVNKTVVSLLFSSSLLDNHDKRCAARTRNHARMHRSNKVRWYCGKRDFASSRRTVVFARASSRFGANKSRARCEILYDHGVYIVHSDVSMVRRQIERHCRETAATRPIDLDVRGVRRVDTHIDDALLVAS